MNILNMRSPGITFLIALIGCFFYPGFSVVAHAQDVSGQVTDGQTLESLPGVNISVKGLNSGTSTDSDGIYSLTVPSLRDTLVFSFIGYQTLEVPINGRTTLNVTLQSETISGQEVVIIGYGEVQKRDLTGSVSSVSESEFNAGVQVSPDQLIEGKVPGLEITKTSWEPGGGVSIRIRGTNSITAGNEPLYVVDGLPGAPLNAINPDDIESIEVLKDASATAIYGSRGANGVILITTKKGVKGDLRINYNASWGTQRTANKLDLLNGREYMTFLNDLREDQGAPPLFSQEEISAVGEGTDWQDAVLRTAPVQDHQLSFSGGSEETQYYISLNYLDQKGIVRSTNINRYAARININHSVNRFNFGLNLNTSLVNDENVPMGGINAGAGVIPAALQMDPVMPVRNDDGNYAESTTLDLNNPVAQAETIYNQSKTTRTFGNIFAGYEILQNLNAKLNFGSNRRVLRSDNYLSKVTKRGQRANGRASIFSNEGTSYLAELTLNYQEDFARHHIDAVAGYTFQEFIGRGFSATAQDFPTDAFNTDNLGAGAQEDYTVGSGKGKNQLLSYLGRVNYSFLDKYLATVSFRIDGSSRFGEDQKYGYFPSLALGWRLSEESIFSNQNFVSNLKIRGSYGVTGNQEIGNYNSLVLLGTVGDAVFNGTRFVGIAPIQLANPDLKWETTRQLNVGFDYGLLDDRITGTFDYFVKHTSDLLLRLPIPNTSGFGSSLQNIGDTKNSGFEFLVETRNLVGNFSWSTTLNFSTIENEVTNLGDLPFILQGGIRFLDNFTILREGEPINSYFGYEIAGIFQSQQEVDESSQPFAQPGDLRFIDQITVDTDGDGIEDATDGVINADDRTVLGDPFPDFSIGLNNDFAYKGFGLSVFIEGSYGAELLNFTKIDSENPISFRRNRQAYVLDRWTPENPSTENPSFLNANLSRAVNSRVVEDASFIRLKNISLSYDFPNFKIGGVRGIRLYATGQNLLTITDYSGYDPNVSVLGGSNLRVDYNPYPPSRIYTLGINLEF